MILEDLHPKQFLLMNHAERIQFMEVYRLDRLKQLETVEAKSKKKYKRASSKEPRIKVTADDLNIAKKLGLL